MTRQEWTDQEILEMLHLRENEGLTCAAAGQRLGRNKNAVIGMGHRIAKAQLPGDAGDGTMPPRWWERGNA